MTLTSHAFAYALDQIAVPGGQQLWLYGEPGIARGHAYQPWQQPAAALAQRGCEVFPDLSKITGNYAAIFVDAPQQRDESEGLIAFALAHSTGFVIAAAANDAGGSRLLKTFQAYGIESHSLSKHHCRIVWTTQATQANAALVAKNLAMLEPRTLTLDGQQWCTVPGIFGWDKIDTGSRLLVEHLPKNLSGNMADFGCGYGYLTRSIAQHHPSLMQIDAFDADTRAIACTTQNAGTRTTTHWQDIRNLEITAHYDTVVMNPPFHSGKTEDKTLGQVFVEKAWAALKPRGRLFLVANRHLPYEKIVPGLNILHEESGYKIITGKKP